MSKRTLFLVSLLMVVVFTLTACSTSTGDETAETDKTTNNAGEHDNNHNMDDDDHESDHEHENGAGDNHDEDNPNHEGDEDHAHDDGDHVEMSDDRVPNNGASIRLLAPADSATFAAGEAVTVEIATDNITVGEDGNHWHVYVDGSSWGMVMGRNMSEIVRGLEPGTHELAVYLSIDTHEELERGDSATITVTE